MKTPVLFDVPATGQVTSKRKASTVDRIKVNHAIANAGIIITGTWLKSTRLMARND